MRNINNNNTTTTASAGSDDPQDDVARQNYALNGKIMLCSVIILVAAVFVIFGFHSYARCLLRRRRSRRHQNHHLFHSAAGAPPQQGLDPAVLKSLPTFTFSAAGHRDSPLPECAVCLSDFRDEEAGRVLPKCGHTFHADCIDMWFRCHSNCPLCRAPVKETTTVQEEGVSVSVVSILVEPACSEPAELEQAGSSASASSSEEAEAGSGVSTPELKDTVGSRILTVEVTKLL